MIARYFSDNSAMTYLPTILFIRGIPAIRCLQYVRVNMRIFGVANCPYLTLMAILCCMASRLAAGQFGDFTYTDDGTAITITDYPKTGTGTVDIPETIVGKPVTSIGSRAFQYCSSLSSVLIPASVTSIGSFAFFSCGSLAHIVVPVGVTSIGEFAFYDCGSLPCIAFPASVTSIGDFAFYNCGRLTSASFAGNAPAIGISVFHLADSGFKVRSFVGKWGFAATAWNDYATFNMGAATSVTSWLVTNNLPYDASLLDDPNDDGVNLLLAYALNLDPQRNLSASMPQPLLVGGHLSLRFYAGNIGVTYAVQASSDLLVWGADGVTVSGLDASQVRTATVNLPGSKRFLRLVVEAP